MSDSLQWMVRRASMADVTALAGLRWRWDGDGGELPADFLAMFAGWYADNETTPLPFVGVVDNQVSGMAWLALGSRVPTPTRRQRSSGDVQSVYVIPELRNLGVGAALMGAIVAEAHQRRLTYLTVHAAEAAI